MREIFLSIITIVFGLIVGAFVVVALSADSPILAFIMIPLAVVLSMLFISFIMYMNKGKDERRIDE